MLKLDSAPSGIMTTGSTKAPPRKPRAARLALRATPEQERVLRRADDAAHKSMTNFILESAYQAAEQTLIDKRLFVVSGNQARSLLELFERPTEDNAGLRDLFSRPEPWETR
jgi:uncharacterized protein (DUF1778 family)